jgi:hypothetical protein
MVGELLLNSAIARGDPHEIGWFAARQPGIVRFLEHYREKARFALADSYDRATQAQARSAPE